MALWGEPEAPGARHCEKFDKVRGKTKLTWELNWEPFGTHFETVASQNRADKRFIALLCYFFSRAFLAVFRVKFLEEIVESRRRPMCV